MSDAAWNRAKNPEQLPAMTALTSMFPIYIDTPDPHNPHALHEPAPSGRSAQGPLRNANRPPIRHTPDAQG